ncbi:BHLH domain-containing protein [Mycena venus]|uniref:BHLH domain-containing protein n=1 Tax=Mycena venus TaxID=2733690 RepID=A0A8H6YZC2_9AGAR|nr:BHLH domain-containing protein [Mycena venus]
MQPNWLSLPVEIWLQIFSLRIPLRDLAGFCLTCSHFLSITRPILFHKLTLTAEKKDQSPNSAVVATFTLLANNADLARSVRELTLDSHSQSASYFRNPGLVDIHSLRNMTQLKRVTIIGDISRHAARSDMASFLQILYNLQLDELRIPSPGARLFILPLGPAELDQLANPKRITFYVGPADNNELLSFRLSNILRAAKPSLTSLSLTGRSPHLNALFSLQFPLLRSLAIINTFDIRLSCPPGFNAFLSVHHETLEELHLGYTDRSEFNNGPVYHRPAAILLNAESGLHPDFLPNLKVFRGHCLNIELMARARMRCLTGFRELTVSSALQDSDRTMANVEQMLVALEAAGRLDALKILDFDLFQWNEHERDVAASFVKRIAALCGPTLEVWRGLLPFAFADWWPIDVFATFSRLRIISLPRDETTLEIFAPFSPRAAVRGREIHEIAEICTTLEEVNIVSSLVSDEEDTCWKVYRSRSGLGVKQISGPDLRLLDEPV